MEGTAAKEALAAREARLAGVARAARVRAAAEVAAAALDPEPEVAAEIVPNLLDDLPSGVLDKILGEVCQVVSTANLYRLSEVSTEFRDSPILKAAKNSAKANYERGNYHYSEEDYEQAFPFLEKAATPKDEYKGYVEAQHNLGHMYYYGRGVDSDYTKAIEWYQLAADQEYAQAQYSLGDRYYHV